MDPLDASGLAGDGSLGGKWGVRRRVCRKLKRAVARAGRAALAVAGHYGLCVVLWLDHARSRRADEPRTMVAIVRALPACSARFVSQELLELRSAGFPLRILYRRAAPALGASWPGLRPFAVRTTGSRFVARIDMRFFRRRYPERVDELLRLLAGHTGLGGADLLQSRHVLPGFSLARYARAWRADYIHSYLSDEGTLSALVAATLLRLPRGVSCWSGDALGDDPPGLAAARLARLDVVAAASASAARELARQGPAAARRILVKPDAVDVQRWTPTGAPRHGIVALHGRGRAAGLEVLVQAAALLRDRGLVAPVCILGEPGDDAEARRYDAELRADIRRLGLTGRVSLPGAVTPAARRLAMLQAAIFVSPATGPPEGDEDAAPVALLEAMACALAAVVTQATAFAQVIRDGSNGRIVPPLDAVALADTLEELLTAPHARRVMAARARETVAAQFDPAVCEAAFHQAIRRAVEQAAARRGTGKS